MPQTNYKPSIGETVFVSLSGNLPILITVTGFHYHPYLKEEVMDYTRLNGKETWSSYKNQTFFTEIPTSTPFLYLAYSQENDCPSEEAFFFSAKEAHAYIDTLSSSQKEDYIVEVRRVS